MILVIIPFGEALGRLPGHGVYISSGTPINPRHSAGRQKLKLTEVKDLLRSHSELEVGLELELGSDRMERSRAAPG